MQVAAASRHVEEFLHELARRGDLRTWEAGATVVREGDPADAMYLIHEGELKVVVEGEGGRQVELNTLRTGEFFGELMFSGERRSATVQTINRARLTRVTRAEVQRLLAERPDLSFELVQALGARVRELTRTVRNMASTDVYGRLVGLFEALAVADGEREGERDGERDGDVRHVPGPLSQQRIAERVGASKAMVNRLMQDLERGGYITVSRERITLHKKLPPRW